MFSRQHSLRLTGAGLALLLLPLAPAWGQAETITLRNESQTPVQVRVTVLLGGRAIDLRPVLLNPRMTLPPIRLAGDKIITLFDARRPTQALFKGTIQSSPMDQTYSIQQDLPPPKLKLVPANPAP
jgi:hypothetical protein